MNSFKPFLTGSRVYGKPTKNSDLDIVMLLSDSDKEMVIRMAKKFPIKFGNLNIIIAKDEEQYKLFRKGTKDLLEIAPVTREYAIEHFEILGIPRSEKMSKEESIAAKCFLAMLTLFNKLTNGKYKN